VAAYRGSVFTSGSGDRGISAVEQVVFSLPTNIYIIYFLIQTLPFTWLKVVVWWGGFFLPIVIPHQQKLF
jgi:hypothetical protein